MVVQTGENELRWLAASRQKNRGTTMQLVTTSWGFGRDGRGEDFDVEGHAFKERGREYQRQGWECSRVHNGLEAMREKDDDDVAVGIDYRDGPTR